MKSQLTITFFSYFLLIGLVSAQYHDVGDDSFSFHRFSGPVSGELTEVVYPNRNPNRRRLDVDYEAKPDYAYIYGVQDNDSGNSQTHKETRDGDKVHGEYRVLQADGMVRIVRYTADPITGFTATVDYTPA
ncbi:hypothetical protein NQ314_012546 [Rhamnusium bicolor]|uniref:Uncharacterized protein n=1 Tax=Rhamnusium bicolor TaxID=1586634 RepID=A0AAV8XBY7_9CUCU|nr:hypothetical protein NQ314_012546 [Rhamnusium bicolor]